MAPTKDDHVLEDLSATTTGPALRHRILPRTAARNATGLDTHRPDSVHDGRIEDRVTVEDEVLRRGVEGKRFSQLLDDPRRCRVERRVDVQDTSPTVLYYEGRAFVRRDDWKLVNLNAPFDESTFELYNLADDPGETTNLRDTEPERFAAMVRLWHAQRQEIGIVLPDGQ